MHSTDVSKADSIKLGFFGEAVLDDSEAMDFWRASVIIETTGVQALPRRSWYLSLPSLFRLPISEFRLDWQDNHGLTRPVKAGHGSPKPKISRVEAKKNMPVVSYQIIGAIGSCLVLLHVL